MPYIKQEDRQRIDAKLSAEYIVDVLTDNRVRKLPPGELNYFISGIVWTLFRGAPSYTHANELVGVLECVKQEFIRRQLNPYEDTKVVENGDL
jgi:hypothetical protein